MVKKNCQFCGESKANVERHQKTCDYNKKNFKQFFINEEEVCNLSTNLDLNLINIKFNLKDPFVRVLVTKLNEHSDPKFWFSAKDVCKAIGYKDTDQAIRDHVDDKNKFQFPSKKTVIELEPKDGKTRVMVIHQKTIVISESGLYDLFLGCRVSESNKFRKLGYRRSTSFY